MVVLWVLMVLTLLAVGVGRQVCIERMLVRHRIGQLRAKYLAIAGVNYVLAKIAQEEKENRSAPGPRTGIRWRDGQTPESVFWNVWVGEGYFDIYHERVDAENQRTVLPGIDDEESRININAVTTANFDMLKFLLMDLGCDPELSSVIAASVVDWRDENDDVFNAPYGAEQEYYLAEKAASHCKNGPGDALEEILSVRGMTRDIFERVKGFLTIYPARGKFLLNIDSASEPVLTAFAKRFAGTGTNTSIEDAVSLVRKILSYRKGKDQVEATPDDRTVDFGEMRLTAKEKVIAAAMGRYRTTAPKFFRMKARGVDGRTGHEFCVEVVLYRPELSVVHWRRQ